MSDAHAQHEDNPLQGYFEWQVTTLMLAYDLVDPIHDEQAANRRRREIEMEVGELSRAALPRELLEDPQAQWDPSIMPRVTRATLKRAFEITRHALT